MSATAILEVLSVITSLLQLAREANVAATELMAGIDKARAENRELTDEELDAFRKKAVEARARLSGMS